MQPGRRYTAYSVGSIKWIMGNNSYDPLLTDPRGINFGIVLDDGARFLVDLWSLPTLDDDWRTTTEGCYGCEYKILLFCVIQHRNNQLCVAAAMREIMFRELRV